MARTTGPSRMPARPGGPQWADERLGWTIAELVGAYRSGSTSPVEILQAALVQMEAWEPTLNAFIAVCADEARAAAGAAEQAYRAARRAGCSADLPPLLGVPIGLKDLVDVAGLETTCGSRILRGHTATTDALVWTRLREAGALLLGKTNLLEFAYGVPHPDFGQTNNPHCPRRTSGGSSGGSAAAVAAGMLFGAVGTDTGGSIRIPAAYCGVAGLKPTYGLVPTDGVFPLSHALDHVGPIGRTAADLSWLLEAMAGSALGGAGRPLDAGSIGGTAHLEPGRRGGQPVTAADRPLRAGVLPAGFLRHTKPSVRQAYNRALQTLESMGVELEELPATGLAALEAAEETLLSILLPEAAEVHRPWWDRASDYAPLTWQQIDAGRQSLAVDYLHALAAQRELRRTVDGWFTRYHVLVTPTVDFPAPAEDPAIGDATMDEMRYTGPFNVSGHPAVSICCGRCEEGLPVGLQLVGLRCHDLQLLRWAAVMEASLGV
ncbi:MAG: amidase [Alicyclobacillus sp.]|nr:amidase [Alicyclobacillus sp.]